MTSFLEAKHTNYSHKYDINTPVTVGAFQFLSSPHVHSHI